MANVQISDLADAILPIDTVNTFFELQTIEGGIQVSRKLSAQDLGIGGGVTGVNSGVNITIDNTDPQQPIVNLDASITGVAVNSVTLSAAGAATNYLDETGNYSVPPSGGGQVDSVVGGTNISVNAADPVNPIVNLDASISGMTVNGVVLTTAGVATNYLDETGAYSVPPSGGTPGGANTQVQFNNAGAFGGSANFEWDGTSVRIDGASGQLIFDGAAHECIVLFSPDYGIGVEANATYITSNQFIRFYENSPDGGVSDSLQHDTINGDTVITGGMDATDFNGVALTTAGAATNYLDETGAYSVPPAGAVPDPLILGSINLTSALSTSTLGAPYINVPINVGANLVGTQGMTQVSRQRIQTKPSAFSFNSTLFINIDGAGTSGSDTIIGGLNSANIEIEFGVAVRMQHGSSGLHVFETIGTGIYLEQGSCFIQEKATAEANTAGRGELWVRNDAPNVLVFTDDTGVDTVLGAGGGGISATPTPASGELAVWDSTGATLAGESELFYTGTTLRINNGLGGACLDLRDGNSTGAAASVNIDFTDQVGTVLAQVGAVLGILLLQNPTGQVSLVAGTGGTAKVTMDALSIQLEETAAPGLNNAGYGQIWVRNTAPDNLYFTDDTDEDFPVGYAKARQNSNASFDFNTANNVAPNRVLFYDDGAAYTVTTEDSGSTTNWEVGTAIQVLAPTAGTITIAEGTGTTLFEADGTDTVGGGTLTAGVVTIYRASATDYYIWGSGFTP